MPKRAPRPVKRVGYVLKRHGLSYRALAKLMDVRPATVSDWVNGHHKIPKVYLEKLRAVHEELLRKEAQAKAGIPPLESLD